MSLRTIAKTCMSTMAAATENKILAAVVQLTSTSDKEANLARATSHVRRAAAMGAKVAFQ